MEHPEIHEWLRWFAEVVRSRDLEAAKVRFRDDCLAFGTLVTQARGKEALAENQWAPIWNTTRDFDFDYSTLEVMREGNLAVAALLWSSHDCQGAEPHPLREGRATVVLRQTADGWVAVHTHFSLNPS